jgi:hypothetical protein
MALTVIKSSGTSFIGNVATNVSTLYGGSVPPIVCNDVSLYFDGSTAVFSLKQDYNSINNVVYKDDTTIMAWEVGTYIHRYIHICWHSYIHIRTCEYTHASRYIHICIRAYTYMNM